MNRIRIKIENAHLNELRAFSRLIKVFFSVSYNSRPEFVSVYKHPALVAIGTQLAGDHLDRHSDFDRLAAKVCQLSGHHRTFAQLDQRHGIGCGVVIAAGCLVNGREGKNFAFTAERIEGFRFASAGRANVAGWEDLVIAVRADFAHKSVSLLLKSPMARDFHNNFSLLRSARLILVRLALKNYQGGKRDLDLAFGDYQILSRMCVTAVAAGPPRDWIMPNLAPFNCMDESALPRSWVTASTA
jgi:hypothetical protein